MRQTVEKDGCNAFAISQSMMCARESAMTSWPGCVCSRIAIWLPMVPEGTKERTSRPKISAARRGVRGKLECWVFAVDVVADFGRRLHRRAHFRTGPGNGIGTKIDDGRHNSKLFLVPCSYGIFAIGSSMIGERLPSFTE